MGSQVAQLSSSRLAVTLASSDIRLSKIVCSTPSKAQITIGATRMNTLLQMFFLWYAHDLRNKALTWRTCTCKNQSLIQGGASRDHGAAAGSVPAKACCQLLGNRPIRLKCEL